MAIIKSLPATKSLSSQLKYLEKEGKTIDELKEGINCTTDNVEREFNIIKNLYNKTGGKQYYHFTQAFSPEDNITPEKAHKLGREWIENNIKDHQVYMVTHIDKNHIHNHFVINSVNMDNGLKLQINPSKLMEMKKDSNRLCEREKLSKINLEPNKGISKTDSEYRLEKKGITPWKDELRQCIDFGKSQTSSIEELKEFLKEHFSIEVRETKNSISYKHPEQNKSVRGNKLGGSYTKEGLLNEFDGKVRSNEKGSGRTEGAKQVTRAEYEGENGVREYTSEGKLGEINDRIQSVERTIKGNFDGAIQAVGEENKRLNGEQPRIEKESEHVLQKVSRRMLTRDYDFER
ncbi:relaxase/mobilization nuclease domain-containing protein (plasmid) [Clostridium septicum]|uniref:relaxase/mobilization nuclease domain-containing protein n=1 Tax=Clostridium septicum TaxID=1504 RepID=UPI000829B870|nr:relaxase/mobilization nuclease domain-containing protein [Clostridium septicum]